MAVRFSARLAASSSSCRLRDRAKTYRSGRRIAAPAPCLASQSRPTPGSRTASVFEARPGETVRRRSRSAGRSPRPSAGRRAGAAAERSCRPAAAPRRGSRARAAAGGSRTSRCPRANCSSRVAALGRIGLLQHGAELHRQLDEGAHMRRALAFVGVEQAIGRAAAQHGVELPGEVGGIAHAGAHALAEEGRRLVAGVAGQQQPPSPPALRTTEWKV